MFHSRLTLRFELGFSLRGWKVSFLKIQNPLSLKVPAEVLSGSSLRKSELVSSHFREKWNKTEEKHLERNSWLQHLERKTINWINQAPIALKKYYTQKNPPQHKSPDFFLIYLWFLAQPTVGQVPLKAGHSEYMKRQH